MDPDITRQIVNDRLDGLERRITDIEKSLEEMAMSAGERDIELLIFALAIKKAAGLPKDLSGVIDDVRREFDGARILRDNFPDDIG